MLLIKAAILVVLAAATAAVAQTTYKFTTFTIPNSSYTDTVGINEAGAVSGYYGVPGTSLYQGFVRSPSGKITMVSYPGQDATTAGGINDFGVVAGGYASGSVVGGFFYRDGRYQNAVVKGQPATLNDINDEGYYVGSYGSIGSFTAFLASPSGVITDLRYPGAVWTQPLWVKPKGVVIGLYTDTYAKNYTFLYSPAGGYKTLSIPGVPGATIVDVNSRGVMVGGYFNGVTDRGFVYQNGEFQIVLPPGANDGAVSAINNKGQLVGVYTIPGGEGNLGFVATPVSAGVP